MRKGINKYTNSMEKAFGYAPSDDALRVQLDLWFQHDSERNDYFDHLIDENSNHSFDKVCKLIITDDESDAESGNESDAESGNESDSSEGSGKTIKLSEIIDSSSDEE